MSIDLKDLPAVLDEVSYLLAALPHPARVRAVLVSLKTVNAADSQALMSELVRNIIAASPTKAGREAAIEHLCMQLRGMRFPSAPVSAASSLCMDDAV